ncbi:MAG: winged helix-turn-helix transcriptional regulator, partial [Actinobacteria bacterium]|nr:winged helix-turn-helix transcriptional regulator [Actinomycetota bacterium]
MKEMAYKDRDNIIFKVLKYYYTDGLSQVEIAAKLDISRVAVSRYISRAKRDGLVELKIKYPNNFAFERNEELEKKIKKQYN